MSLLKQSTARDKMVFMTDSSDHITGKTGLTLTITASKNGAAFASITPTVTERGNGWYSLSLTSSHTDTLGDLALHVTGTAADPSDLVWEIVSLLPGDAVTISGTLSTIDAIWAKIQKWLRFVLRGDAGLATDQSTELSEINQDMGSGSGSFSNINDSLEANQTNIGANGANLYVNINSGAITSSVLDVTALLEIRNKFLILQDTLNAPTVTSTTVVLNGSNAANDDAYNGMLLANFNAAGELKQVRTVTDYDNATLTVTVDRPWASNPADTDVIRIYEFGIGLPRINPLKGVALSNFEFTMYDSTNHAPAAGLTVTAQRSIDGGAYAACANAVSEVSDGTYKISLASTDMAGNVIKLKFTATGADQQDITLVTQE